MAHLLTLQSAEETPQWCAIMQPPPLLMLGLNAIGFQYRLVATVGVLIALIAVVDQACTGTALMNGHAQGSEGQLCGHRVQHSST